MLSIYALWEHIFWTLNIISYSMFALLYPQNRGIYQGFLICFLQYITRYIYLGAVLTSDLTDDVDVHKQIRWLYSRANMLAKKFAKYTHETKLNVFRVYCGNTYYRQLWPCIKTQQFNKLKVAYNNSFRIVFGLPRRCAPVKYVSNRTLNFGEHIKKEIYSFWRRVLHSEISLLRSATDSVLGSIGLFTYERWVKILHCHSRNILTLNVFIHSTTWS